MRIRVTFPDDMSVMVTREVAMQIFVKFYEKEPVNTRDISFNPYEMFEELLRAGSVTVATREGEYTWEVVEG